MEGINEFSLFLYCIEHLKFINVIEITMIYLEIIFLDVLCKIVLPPTFL